MFCKKCGAEIPGQASFCPKCGNPVSPGQGQPNFQDSQAYTGNQPYGQQSYGQQSYGSYHKAGSQAPGNILLIIAGVLLLIGGLVTIVNDMSSLRYLGWLGGGVKGAVVFEIFLGIVMLAAGAMSLAFYKKKDKAGILLGLGILLVVMRIISWIWVSALVAGLVSVVSFGDFVFGLITPVLMMVGAYLNKKA